MANVFVIHSSEEHHNTIVDNFLTDTIENLYTAVYKICKNYNTVVSHFYADGLKMLDRDVNSLNYCIKSDILCQIPPWLGDLILEKRTGLES